MNREKMRIWTEIDLGALKKNIREVRKMAGPKAKVLIVVKSDAYGHGMISVAKTLATHFVRPSLFFGVGRPEEAAELRRVGIGNPILMLGPFLSEEVKDLFKYDVTPTISNLEGAMVVDQEARKKKTQKKVHLKIDTGMGRYGVWYEDALDLVGRLKKRCTHLELEGVMTHFSDADNPQSDFTRVQAKHFNRFLEHLKKSKHRPRFIHAANSAAIVWHGSFHFNMIRPGICTYGVLPGLWRGLSVQLKPVLTWKARVTLVREIPAGRFLSYRRSFQTSRKTRIATVSVGYADGYPISLSNRGLVLIRGKRVPVVGQVTMDQLLVDVGQVKGVCPRDEVVLIGRQGRGEIRVEELSEWAGTIPYELLCGISKHIPRCYAPSVKHLPH